MVSIERPRPCASRNAKDSLGDAVSNKVRLYVTDASSIFESLMAWQNYWIVPQFLNLRPKMAKSIVYVITLITNRNHAFHCLN